VLSRSGTTKAKSVVPNWEQKKPKVLFRNGNNKNKNCCSKVGTTETNSVVLKWEQKKQEVQKFKLAIMFIGFRKGNNLLQQ